MTRRAVPAGVALAVAAIVAAEWMRAPGWILAAGTLLAAALAVWSAGDEPGGPSRIAAGTGALAALILAGSIVGATGALRRTERRWPEVRADAIASASSRLGRELDGAVRLARGLADGAASAAALPDAEAFAALGRLAGGGGPSHGVVLFDTAGRPRAWGGIQRTVLRAGGADLSAVTTPFYLWLVARRQTREAPAGRGGTAVAAVLLARSDDVPRALEALTDRFADATGVGLRFLDPRVAPPDSDVYDYVLPGAHDTLFAVQPVPPSQSVAYGRALAQARRGAAWLILVVLLAAGVLAARGDLAPGLAVGAAWLAALARAPLEATFGAGSVFWPDTYSRPLLGPFSASAGALILTGIVAFAAGAALWRRGGPRSPWKIVLALAGALAAPYVLQTLARGISPPASGVTLPLWLTWQVAIMLAAGSLVLVAAALVRGPAAPARAGAWPLVACALALGAALIGLLTWTPGEAWPEWYQYLWIPPLLLALRPMPLRGTLATIAVVAGSSGALLTWRATIEGRMALATADVQSLGDQAEPPSVQVLERAARELRVTSVPRTPGALFVLWRRSIFGAREDAAALAVWEPDGRRSVALDLVRLDLPEGAVGRLADSARARGRAVVGARRGVPGMLGVAAIPLAAGRVLTIVVGPRTQLLAPTGPAQLLLGTSAAEPPYDLLLTPPVSRAVAPFTPVAWRRDGWTLRGDRPILLPDGAHHVHAAIDLRGPSALLQRAFLVLALDVAVLLGLWSLLDLAAGRGRAAIAAWWMRGRRSLRLRLTLSLVLFFTVPVLAFAAWTLGRFQEQFRGARELLLERTLRDAAAILVSDSVLTQPALADSAVADASRSVDAEVLLSRAGSLAATSAPVLEDLGLADVLVPSTVYERLALGDEVSLTAWQAASTTPTLVGYRLVSRAGPGGALIVAAPDVAGDRGLRRREDDLLIAVLVGALVGLIAAGLLSALAARALARPLQRLRGAALGVAAGTPPPLAPEDVPVELEPIRGALQQAAADVEAGQRAQRVLAWGEMARQVAHEIKNPLTPIRLGIQHLLRVGRDRPAEVGGVLAPTGERILAEIERLDAIARAFSRFALPAAEGAPVEAVAVAAVAQDVARLYRMGEGPPEWIAEAEPGTRARARRDELFEVLVNLCENAREAGAARVVIAARAEPGRAVIEVRDDGRGIPPDVLPRIFEPRFSTTTSGSGLGLAIAKRLVESWGGTIGVTPAPGGRGTVVRLVLRSAEA